MVCVFLKVYSVFWTHVLEFLPGKAASLTKVLQKDVSFKDSFLFFLGPHTGETPVFSVEQKQLHLCHDSANAS